MRESTLPAQVADMQRQLRELQVSILRERMLRLRQAGKFLFTIWHLDHYGPFWAEKDPQLDAIRMELTKGYDVDGQAGKLVRSLDRELGGVLLSLLKRLHLEDNPREQRLLCYCLLDLPAEMVADKLGWTANNARVRKSRLRKQVLELNDPDYDALFNIRR